MKEAGSSLLTNTQVQDPLPLRSCNEITLFTTHTLLHPGLEMMCSRLRGCTSPSEARKDPLCGDTFASRAASSREVRPSTSGCRRLLHPNEKASLTSPSPSRHKGRSCAARSPWARDANLPATGDTPASATPSLPGVSPLPGQSSVHGDGLGSGRLLSVDDRVRCSCTGHTSI